MHRIENGILETFRREPARSFSTTDLVHNVFKEEYAAINQHLQSGEKRSVRKGYAEKAKLHRKLLYHVTKLVDEKLLIHDGYRGKGEKLFRLGLDDGQIVVHGKDRRIVIAKHAQVTTPIDGYEQEGLIKKYRPETWLTKHDALLVDCLSFPDAAALQRRLQHLFPCVADSLALERFDHLLGVGAYEDTIRLLDYLAMDAHDYDVAVALLINLSSLEQEAALLRLLRERLATLPPHLSFVFTVTPRGLAKKEQFFKELLPLFHDAKRKLTLKNNALFPQPAFFGRAGPYALTPEDWERYRNRFRGKADCCVIGQTSMAIDINHWFEGRGTINGFRDMALRAAHALFEVEEQRRRQPGLLAPGLGPEAANEFFKVGKCHLRFWNYDWAQTAYPVLDLLGSVQEEIERFCTTQETIFKSCGLPIRFRIGLSTSFAKFDQDFFSERRYRKTALATIKELQGKEMKQYLQIREQLFKTFKGADRLRFFFARGTPVEELLRMARYLLSAHDLPSFTFDFRGKSGELKLTTFLEDA